VEVPMIIASQRFIDENTNVKRRVKLELQILGLIQPYMLSQSKSDEVDSDYGDYELCFRRSDDQDNYGNDRDWNYGDFHFQESELDEDDFVRNMHCSEEVDT
jgi:hypothetical protein